VSEGVRSFHAATMLWTDVSGEQGDVCGRRRVEVRVMLVVLDAVPDAVKVFENVLAKSLGLISGHVGTAQKPLIAARHVHAMEIPACVVDYGAPHLSQGSRVTGHKMVLVCGLDIMEVETC